MKPKFIFALFFIVVSAFIVVTSIKKIKKPGRPRVGDGLPIFQLKSLDNKTTLTPDSLKGKVLFINFWASWCGPCREELPSINNLNKIMAGKKDFKMVTIAYNEPPQTSLNYLKKHSYDVPVYFDLYKNAAKSFKVTGVPETFIITKAGKVAKVRIGPDRWDSGGNIQLINSLLRQ